MNSNKKTKSRFESLAKFSIAYSNQLNELFKNNKAVSLQHHKDNTDIICTFIAKDGISTFYMPGSPDDSTKNGYYLIEDYADKTLNQICQSLSVHRLKVSIPDIGIHHSEINLLPEDTGIPGLSSPWIHTDLRNAAIAGKLSSLPGMTITPIINVEKGLCTSIKPGRTKIWSPIFNFPGLGDNRLFLWTHADFWWKPDLLSWSEVDAVDIATNDFLAFSTILRQMNTFGSEQAQQDTSTHAADIFEGYCKEFSMLLDEFGDTEERIHQWLKEDKHQIFINSNIKTLWSKLPFGKKISDFVLKHSDDTYTLVEIERANLRVFRKSDSEQTAEFNHACQQVRDWQRYIRDNVHTVRSELGLSDIYEPKGMVVLGRSEDIDQLEAKSRWRDIKNRHDHKVYTYDDLIENVKILASKLRELYSIGG
jgi:Shedu protein SduA, C-terminal